MRSSPHKLPTLPCLDDDFPQKVSVPSHGDDQQLLGTGYGFPGFQELKTFLGQLGTGRIGTTGYYWVL